MIALRLLRVAAAGIAMMFAAVSCGGGGSQTASVPIATASYPATIGSGVAGTLSLVVSNGTAANVKGRAPKFVSPGAVSAGISINGGATAFADVSATSTACTTTAGTRTCSINVNAPVGNAAFAISLYDGISGAGHLLGAGSNSTTVVAGTPFNVMVGVNPVIASLVSLSHAIGFTYGVSGTVTVTPTFADASGQQITGSGNVPNFLKPITITSSDPHIAVSPATLTTPGQSWTFTYDGSPAVASTVTVAGGPTGNPTAFNSQITLPGLTVNRYNLGAIGSGGTISPAQLVVGSDNNIWWAETATHQIGRIVPGTGVITEFPSGLATGPIGIASGGDNNIWYSDGNRVIARMTTLGNQLGQITVGANGSQINRLTTDSQGNVWYVNGASTFSQVAYVDKNTLLPQTFGSTPTAGAVTSFASLTLGSDNAIWFTETGAGVRQIGRITTPANGTAGTYFEYPIPNSGPTILPFDITKGPDGKIWVSVFASVAANQFYMNFLPTSPTTVNEYPNLIDPNAFANLVTIFPGSDGNIWIAEGGGAVKIPPGNPTAPVTQFFTDTGQTSMNNCISGPDGNLWCTAIGGPSLCCGFIPTADSIITWKPR